MTLEIFIHDVGHGQAVHAFTPNGQSIVIDLGCSEHFSPLEWLRRQTDAIDQLVITHPHGDHIDEILLLKKLGLKVRQLYVPRSLTREAVYQSNQLHYRDKVSEYLEYADGWTSPIAAEERVGDPAVSGGVAVNVFHGVGTAPSNINNHSLVVAFEYANSKIVIPGDNEAPSWRALLADPRFVRAMTGADLFMASHHGRASGYCTELFADGCKPRLCVISDGRVQDTDATARYYHHAQGWTVHRRSGEKSEPRYAVTTRTDGYAHVVAGINLDSTPYLKVTVD